MQGRDRRAHKRRSVSFSAAIEARELGRVICTVVNISHSGARLQVPLTDLPKTFLLLMTADAKVARNCKVVWRKGNEFGVAFTDVGPALEII